MDLRYPLRGFQVQSGRIIQSDLDTMMQAGYYDALANRSEDSDIVFTRIRKRIAEQSVKL